VSASKKTYRPYEPDQLFLLPPSLREWLPLDHPALFVSDIVDELDLSAIFEVYEGEGRGYPPYHPRMMVKILIWGYCSGVRSSRKIARKLLEDVAFRVLAANNTPDFRTISDFRKRHLLHLSGLFDQILGLCLDAGLVKLSHVAVDGTKIRANASKHKAMSYGRMKDEEKRLSKEIQRWFDEADRIDEEEDELYGKDKRGDELPEEFRTSKGRREKIRAAMKRLKERAEERDKEAIEKRKRGEKTRHRRELGEPKDSEQDNFTDPESRIMKGRDGGFVQSYNAQAAVDEEAQVIVAAEVTNVSPDQGHLVPMVAKVKEKAGRVPKTVTADAGYWSEKGVREVEAAGVAGVYVATRRDRHSRKPEAPPRGRIPKDLSPKQRMARKLRTKKGREAYARRKVIVEPVFGQIKQARGIRSFLLRGIEKVRGEWALICAGHNLLKLFRAQTA
jgi:transposase